MSPQPRRFRAEHLGSLIRPESLLKLRAGLWSGATNREELAKAEKDAIRDVVQLQKDVGLKVVSDGEFTRDTLCWSSEGLSAIGILY